MRDIDILKDMLAQRGRNLEGPFPDWPTMRAEMDLVGAATVLPEGWTCTPDELGVRADLLRGPESHPRRAVLYLHGGGYAVGSPLSHRGLATEVARLSGAHAYVPDYRLGPEHTVPAAIIDAEAAYLALIERGYAPGGIVVAGDSAGAGLAVALTQRLLAAGRVPPAALFLISPWADLTQSGRSITLRAASDPILSKAFLDHFAMAYAPGGAAAGTDASPLFGAFDGFPDTLIQVGTDEVLLADAERLQERIAAAGAFASLEVWPGMIHVWHLFYAMLQPARDALNDAGGWVQRRWRAD